MALAAAACCDHGPFEKRIRTGYDGRYDLDCVDGNGTPEKCNFRNPRSACGILEEGQGDREMKEVRTTVKALLIVFVGLGCGGIAETSGSDGEGGQAGKGGTGGKAGSGGAPSGGSGGIGGSGATGGSAGMPTGGTGGIGGNGAMGGSGGMPTGGSGGSLSQCESEGGVCIAVAVTPNACVQCPSTTGQLLVPAPYPDTTRGCTTEGVGASPWCCVTVPPVGDCVSSGGACYPITETAWEPCPLGWDPIYTPCPNGDICCAPGPGCEP